MGQFNKAYLNKPILLPMLLSLFLTLFMTALIFVIAPLSIHAEETNDVEKSAEDDNINTDIELINAENNSDETNQDNESNDNEAATTDKDKKATNEDDEAAADNDIDTDDNDNDNDEAEETEKVDEDVMDEAETEEENKLEQDPENAEDTEEDVVTDDIGEEEKDADNKEENQKTTEEKSTSNSGTMSLTTKSGALSKGDRDQRVVQMKKDLAKAGFGGMNINNLYGSFTATRVKQFQTYYGLKATGKADSITFNKLDSVANSPLQEGKRNNEIIHLKKQLHDVGFGGMNITSLYGSYTAKRVSDFQKHHGLTINGIADMVTLAKLNKLAPISFQQGDRHKDIIQMKRDLTKAGFGGMNINNIYGNFTAQRVNQFQQYYGLIATSVADKQTFSKLKAVANSPLQTGKRHKDTVDLKNKLTKAGFGGMNINNIYGSYTAKRVKDFQKEYGLKVNGIADEVTLAKLNEVQPLYFEQGDRHNDISQMKRDLNKAGFGGMNINNLYGSFTATRVKQFQTYYGLTATGKADITTFDMLDSVANSPLQAGKRHNDTVDLKNKLTKVGFGGMNINNIYGSYTAQRVKDFQKEFGLKVNGIADKVTLAKLNEVRPLYFEQGDRHNDISQMKRDLNKVGFGGMNINNLYGSFTATRVKQFQTYYGLTATGKADSITFNKLDFVANSPLQEGKRHNDTIVLKNNLNKVGFGGMNINNIYGSYTAKRVKDFQRQYGLKVNGIADEITLAKLVSLASLISKKKVIYLDAGHGGVDPGATSNGLREKDLTLDISLRTQRLLEAAGYNVIMSRTTDKTLSLSERTQHANSSVADIFVSIHINAGGGTGIETWKYSNGPKPNESNNLATSIQNEVIKTTKSRDRGVRDKNLHVNRESKMPSALIELGFIDTKADADKLKQTSFKNNAAKGIVNGIKKFFNAI